MATKARVTRRREGMDEILQEYGEYEECNECERVRGVLGVLRVLGVLTSAKSAGRRNCDVALRKPLLKTQHRGQRRGRDFGTDVAQEGVVHEKIREPEQLRAWQTAHQFKLEVYRLIEASPGAS